MVLTYGNLLFLHGLVGGLKHIWQKFVSSCSPSCSPALSPEPRPFEPGENGRYSQEAVGAILTRWRREK